MESEENKLDFSEQEFEIKEPEKKTFWQGVKILFKQYCKSSSIQGLNYLAQEGTSCFERLWWIIILFLCAWGCSFMVYQLIDKWATSPVLVTLATKEMSIHRIPFPAVTICPETKVASSCVNYTETLRKRKLDIIDGFTTNHMFDHMALLCKSENHKEGTLQIYQRHLKKTNKSIPGLKSGADLDNMLQLSDYAQFLDQCKSVSLDHSYCEWMGKVVNCKEALNPILTDEGLCYSFNMLDVRDIYSDENDMHLYREGQRNPVWNPDKNYMEGNLTDSFPRRALLNGAKSSLIVVLFTKKSEVYYTCNDFALQGVRVAIHVPSIVPRPSQEFFSVGLDRLTTVAVSPTLMITSPTVEQYDPEDRNCFFAAERKLKFFKMYSQASCNMECWTNFTTQKCNCVHFYMPREYDTDICSLNKRSCLDEAEVEYQKIYLSNHSASLCNCLPICTSLIYNSEISTGKWKYNKQTDDDMDKLYYSSAVKVFFKNAFFLPTQKDELYGITDFISNAGGILGLFLGFSLFSLAEIVYFLSIKIIENRRLHGYWAGASAVEKEV